MTGSRDSYLISKALNSFMLASVLAALAQRLATMTDAIVVSNLIGPDAISAINVVTPLITLFPAVSILFGTGGSILAAKAIGRRYADEANRIFTTSIVGALVCSTLLTIVLFSLTPDIVALVCPRDSRLFGMAVSFMHIMSLSAIPTVLSFTLQNFVKTDGNPRLVLVTVMSSTALNLVLDIIFVRYFGMGIAGSAWGTIICFLFSAFVCLTHFCRSHSSFRIRFEWRRMGTNTFRCITEGFPASISTLMMGACVYGFNSIVIHTLGADGMYAWSVCLQLFMLIQLMLTGVGSSIYSIGGMLFGERDMPGLNILIRRVLTYVGIVLVVLMLVIEAWPQAFGNLFGGGDSGLADLLHSALRIFSLVLLPYALISTLNALYQILGYRIASIIISLTQLAAMVVFVWLFALISPSLLWWGYPASSITLVAVVLSVTWFMHIRHTELAPVTLIPQVTEGKALNFSVRLTESDVARALERIDAFLRDSDIPHSISYDVRLCSEELLYNILRYAVRKHPDRHFVDMHIRCTSALVTMLLKDDGRPFNPLLGASDSMEHLGLRLVNGFAQDMTYQYMYDQNMVFIKFRKDK